MASIEFRSSMINDPGYNQRTITHQFNGNVISIIAIYGSNPNTLRGNKYLIQAIRITGATVEIDLDIDANYYNNLNVMVLTDADIG